MKKRKKREGKGPYYKCWKHGGLKWSKITYSTCYRQFNSPTLDCIALHMIY